MKDKTELKTQKEIRYDILRKLHREMKIPITMAQKIVDLVIGCYKTNLKEEIIEFIKTAIKNLNICPVKDKKAWNILTELMRNFGIKEQDLKETKGEKE